MNPEKVLVTCQGGGKKPFTTETVLLFNSLKLFGGKLSQAKKIASFTEPIDADTKQRLTKLDVKTRIVEPIKSVTATANKLRNLEFDDIGDIEYVVSLDTDIIVMKDFSSFINGKNILAKPVDMDPLSIDVWKQLFDFFNIEFPTARYKTSFELEETIPYFNGGVLVIPVQHILPLRIAWNNFIQKLMDSMNNLPEQILKHTTFFDQFAFSLAISDKKLPVCELPLEMNFPTHHPIHESYSPQNMKPYLIHHHHLFSDEGKILHCSYEGINKLIDNFNNFS